MIRFENVSIKLNQSFSLSNLNFTIKSGSVFGVVGKSGAGKTTLLNLLTGHIKPDLGHIYVNKQSLSFKNEKDHIHYLKQIGYIFQHFNLLNHLTIIENVMLPLKLNKVAKKQRYKKAYDLLEYVGLSYAINKYPHELSGGEKQRVGIARALINDPKILLCDEMTSALDLEIAYDILKLLKKIYNDRKMTIVYVTHDLEIVKKVCSDVLVLEKGVVKDLINLKNNPFSDSFELDYTAILKGVLL